MGKLDGKIALITGATSGMGEAFAKLFASEGATVAVVGRNEERGHKVVDSIRENGGQAEFFQCDVSSQDSVKELRKAFDEKFDRLDVLVNNAGALKTNALQELTLQEITDVFSQNTFSTVITCTEFIQHILNSKGVILNNASIDGLQFLNRGTKNHLYCMSKAAIIKFSQQLALNYTPEGIRVNCLCPGSVDTPFFTNKDYSRLLPGIPMGRVGRADEIAKAALFLVSDDASFISGSILTVDGGASLL